MSEISQNYIINFTLYRLKVQDLKEVIVVGKIPKFKITKDTIAFKVKEYLDGSEMKVEDVIKK